MSSGNGFVPGKNRGGGDCGNCVRLGHLCGHHKEGAKVKAPAIPGRWERTFIKALKKGHSKSSAAGLAGVTERTYQLKAQNDPDFAAAVEVAYNQGTSWYEDKAQDRIEDVKNPADHILKHMLSSRGITATQQLELSGPDGKPISVEGSGNLFELLSPATKAIVIAEIEAKLQEQEGAAPLQLPEAEVVREEVA